MTEEQSPITLQQIEEAMTHSWDRMEAILPQLGGVLDSGPNESGWTPRQLLSHLVGSWQRVPLHAAFILARVHVPVQVADAFWTPEWETAPLPVFRACLQAGYDANAAFVSRLEPSDLSVSGTTQFGEMTIGELLMLSYSKHFDEDHLPQLEAFAART